MSNLMMFWLICYCTEVKFQISVYSDSFLLSTFWQKYCLLLKFWKQPLVFMHLKGIIYYFWSCISLYPHNIKNNFNLWWIADINISVQQGIRDTSWNLEGGHCRWKWLFVIWNLNNYFLFAVKSDLVVTFK